MLVKTEGVRAGSVLLRYSTGYAVNGMSDKATNSNQCQDLRYYERTYVFTREQWQAFRGILAKSKINQEKLASILNMSANSYRSKLYEKFYLFNKSEIDKLINFVPGLEWVKELPLSRLGRLCEKRKTTKKMGRPKRKAS